MDIQKIIHSQIHDHPVTLYMKGTPNMPYCGFSATAVEILKKCGVIDFFAINILDDEKIDLGIIAYNNWPTFPQLFVRGEFVGGCDIMREMYQSGELQALLQEKGIIPKSA